ncbi:ABC-three component system protein [Kutzneria sp. 744]|uniref:ABC-three component system protein n=1 Tax=Kutzneria sp. (strain 744) TaxID=345341 RepID=UPI00351014C2
MTFTERLAARFLLTVKFEELYEDEFETFFHDLMSVRYPDFVDVRTAGNLGDMGSDGLSLHSGKLYACYGPHAFNEKSLNDKFKGDLEKAKVKRKGQFHTFVFVHNDRRGGLHPAVAGLIATAAQANREIKFDNFGFRRFREEFMRLEADQVEDLLRMELPVKEASYGIELAELSPLLDYLSEQRSRPDPTQPVEAPSELKLDYNKFSEDTRCEIVRFLHVGVKISNYYANLIDITERDEVASSFRQEFSRLRAEYDDPELIVWRLEQYILGNRTVPLRQHNAAKAVVAYFFQTCDIFDNPPDGWVGDENVQVER